VKPGDQVETPDGPGLLLELERVTLPAEHGRHREEWSCWVRLPDGRTIQYLRGVYPAVSACASEDVDESAGLRDATLRAE
jgi:hypothetical protein